MYRLVPDYNVHKGANHPPFGTQGRLIFDVAIAPCTISCFLYFFSIFYSSGTIAAEDNAGDPPPPIHRLLWAETVAR